MGEAWPSQPATAAIDTPLLSRVLANVWRRSWKRTPGNPAPFAVARHRSPQALRRIGAPRGVEDQALLAHAHTPKVLGQDLEHLIGKGNRPVARLCLRRSEHGHPLDRRDKLTGDDELAAQEVDVYDA